MTVNAKKKEETTIIQPDREQVEKILEKKKTAEARRIDLPGERTLVRGTRSDDGMSIKTKETLEKQRLDDSRLVEGMFQYHEKPGSTLPMRFRKYGEDGIRLYHLKDGKTYTVPFAVAYRINKEMVVPVHEYKLDESGKKSAMIGKYLRRCTFWPMNFRDELEPVGEPMVVKP